MSAGWGDLVMMDVAKSAGVGWVWLWMTISYQLTKAQYNAVLGCAWWVWFCVGVVTNVQKLLHDVGVGVAV